MHKINRSRINIFFILVIPILILWSGLTISNVVKEKSYIIDNVISENTLDNEHKSLLIENYMSEIIENIKVIRDADELNAFIAAPSDTSYDEVVQLFVRVMKNKPDYDQLRYIDLNGNEMVRVDNDELPIVITEDDFQNKSDRYYFKNTIDLSIGEVYISPLDLNVEEGQIELPEKPIMRFSTPIFNADNSLKGMLIVNYKADYFVDLISDHAGHDEITNFEYYILNKSGQFISHPDPTMNFSFMYEGKSSASFKDINGSLWDEMVAHEFIGNYVTQNKVFTYYDVLATTQNIYKDYGEHWVIVDVMDVSELNSFKNIIAILLIPYNMFLFFAIVVLSFVIAYIIEQLRHKDNELDITMKIAGSTNDAVIITDGETRITYVNKAYEIATGYKAAEVIGSKPGDYKSGKHGEEFYREMWQSITKSDQWEGVLWDKKKDGLLYPKKLKILAVKNKKNGRTHHYVGIFSNLSANKRKSDTYNRIDYKNGELVIPNEDMMIELLDQSVKVENFSFMVIYLAIENYSQLISSVEEESFDISQVFTDLIKPMIKKDDFIAQTGRNLFAVIVGMNHIEEQPDKFVKRMHKELGKVMDVDGHAIFFKTRVGVSYWPDDTNDIKRLLLNSMIALEWTSHRQESEIAFFDKIMIEQLNQENEIEGHLRKALEKKEFSLVYQPQVDIVTEEVIGMEALLRWNNEALGFISPVVFIPIAEKSRLMIDIGNWVIKKVCEDLKYLESVWPSHGHPLRCAINLSALQMEEANFVSQLFRTVESYQLDPHQLEMEITEGLLLSDERKNVETLNRLRERGITVAIDDFGTGYSSLSYLNTLPIDKIKVDRSFIKNYPEDDDGKLAKILVDMSKTLEMKVLTEGAETLEQVEYLREIGCDYIQGYYYSKPLSIEAFVAFVERHNE